MKKQSHLMMSVGIVIAIAIATAAFVRAYPDFAARVITPVFAKEKVVVTDTAVVPVVAAPAEPPKPTYPPLDRTAYDAGMLALANGDTSGLWPVVDEYPLDGAILPSNRIVAYYGNLYSKRMGILGEYDSATVLKKLQTEVDAWTAADPSRPAIPALHYIVTVAQADPGKTGLYRARMPFSEIDKVIAMADSVDAIVFLDIQVGLSDLQREIPAIEPYLKLPNVHLGIDPEFSMKDGSRPGKKIGTFDAADVNYASEYLAQLVRDNDLPPKVLIVHRFTQKMVTNTANIKRHPEVQIVMNMDGWGHHARKINTYKQFIVPQPVQFTGFKIFYKNDLSEEGGHLLTPAELLKLQPQPAYIQYQ